MVKLQAKHQDLVQAKLRVKHQDIALVKPQDKLQVLVQVNHTAKSIDQIDQMEVVLIDQMGVVSIG